MVGTELHSILFGNFQKPESGKVRRHLCINENSDRLKKTESRRELEAHSSVIRFLRKYQGMTFDMREVHKAIGTKMPFGSFRRFMSKMVDDGYVRKLGTAEYTFNGVTQ